MKIFKIITQLLLGILILIFSIRIASSISSIVQHLLGISQTSSSILNIIILYFAFIPVIWIIGIIFIIKGFRNLHRQQKHDA